MEIEYYEKDNYGTTMMYVADETKARWVRMLTGTKTIQQYHMQALEKLGCEFKQVFPPRKAINVNY